MRRICWRSKRSWRRGAEVVLARSERKRCVLAEQRFRAIILDVMMPGMDGLKPPRSSARRTLRNPILFLRRLAERGSVFKGYDIGAVDYLVKTDRSSILKSKIAVL